jgi:RNA polymerase sigma factor (sigma-70 family)
MRTEDGYIIRKCLDGDSAAFGFLVDKYKESVYAFAYSRLGNFHDAEDVTQEVFISAYQKLRTLRRWDNFLAWLYSITSNLCKNWIRAQSRRPDHELMEDKDLETLDAISIDAYRENLARESLNESLQEALDSLPEMHRQVLILYYLGGMSSKEIARFLGTSRTTVLQRLHRARSQLKEEMLAMMNTTFEAQKLRGGFTFRILEGVKRIKIQPVPRTAGLPWGLSLAASVIIAALTLNPHISMVNPAFAPSGSPLPADAKVLKTGEIPVDILEVSHVSVLASKQGNGEDGLPKLPEMHNAAPLAPQGEGDTWTKKADMPTARTWLSASVVNGKIYAIGGCVGVSIHTSLVEEYDPATNTWTQKADMPTVRDQLSTSAVNGKIYAIGGLDEGVLGSVEEYDPVRDKWTERADMPTARQGLSTSVVNGKIYAIGGWNSNQGGPLSTVEEYDPERDTWTRKSDMPIARVFLSTSVVNGKIYAIGGSNRRMGTNDYEGIPVVEEYDPVTDTWESKADMPMARWSLSVSTVGDRIFAIGGMDRTVPFAAVEEYDPVADTWRKRDDMPTAKGLHSASVVNGKIYVIGGSESWANMFLQTVEEYDPGFVPGESVRADGKFWLPWGKVK